MPNITTFDTTKPYMYLPVCVESSYGTRHEFDAIFDTGAPRTEFSDRALKYAGFLSDTQDVAIPNGLQTYKYDRIILPSITICGHEIKHLDVFVSLFEESWGIHALIGLDFLRRFRTEIDYSKGMLVTTLLA
jgi:hypothetical protein